MTRLAPDWLTQGWIDAEYKKYVVLAYLQSVNQNFTDNKLFPDLPEVRHHYRAGLRFRRGKGTLNAQFPKRVSGIAGPPPRIEYKSEVTDDPYLVELDAILDFALPRFEQALTDGEERWAELVATLTLEPVGLLPLRPEEGYLLLHHPAQPDTAVYYFCLTLYDDEAPGGRQIRFQFRERVRRSLSTTFETIKLNLIRQNRQLPNPATFRLHSRRPLPEEETLLPLAQQLIAQAVA